MTALGLGAGAFLAVALAPMVASRVLEGESSAPAPQLAAVRRDRRMVTPRLGDVAGGRTTCSRRLSATRRFPGMVAKSACYVAYYRNQSVNTQACHV